MSTARSDRVIVVGAGPVGLLCALELARRGIPVLGFHAQTGGNFRQLINRQFQPRWHPSQSGAACLGMHSAPGNADAATPLVRSA